MHDDLTPDTLAELQRLLDEVRDGSPLPWRRIGSRVDSADRFKVAECMLDEDARLVVAAVNALPALPDAAAERDELAAFAQGLQVATDSLRAERDALVAKVERLAGDLVDAGYRQGEDRAERDALRVWQERVALAAGIGDEVEGRGVYLEADADAAAEHVAGLLAAASAHGECPAYCGGCGEALADASCAYCHGSGCGPGTASGAYEECGWCAGVGKVHTECADLPYADLAAERDALADRIGRVRALHFGEYVEDEDRNRCFECGDAWPCPTIRALDGAES